MTESEPSEVFYAAPRLRWLSLVVIPLVFWLTWDQPDTFVPYGAAVVAYVLFLTLAGQFIVSSEGIRAGPLLRLRWEDARGAVVRTWIGRPTLVVNRKRGFRWWIPLDLDNGRSLAEVLFLTAPSDNPIRGALAQFSGPRGFEAPPTRPSGMLSFAGVALLLVNLVGDRWVRMVVLDTDAPELALLPTPLSAVTGEPPSSFSPLTEYGFDFGVPCDLKKPLCRRGSLAIVSCTNGNAVFLHDPQQSLLPWLGNSEANHASREYLVDAAGSDDPVDLMRAWLSMTAADLGWLSSPSTAFTVRFLLEVKRAFLLNYKDLFELTGEVRGFQFGSLERERLVEVVVFEPTTGIHRLGFLNRSETEPLTQSDILAVAASLEPGPALGDLNGSP